MIKKPKIIFFDIETTPLITTRWQYDRNPFINPDTILTDWSIICAAWQTVGETKVHAVSVKEVGDDYEVVKTLRDVLATADVIAGHCADRFDIRNLNARMIYHRITPLPPIPTIDTKKVAKNLAGFSSNKLDYLSKFFGGGGKIHVDYQLWMDVMKGSKKALKEMVTYNKMDVTRNIEVYEVLKPYMKNHPHVGVLNGLSKLHSCPNCGSTKLKRNGIRPTKAGVPKQEVQCGSCGSYHRIPIEK